MQGESSVAVWSSSGGVGCLGLTSRQGTHSALAWGGLTWLQSRAHVLHLFSFSRSRGRRPIGPCLPASLHNELRPSSCPSNACSLLSSLLLSRPRTVSRAQPTTQDFGEGRGEGGFCLRQKGSGEGGASSSGVPRWGATCEGHTWSGDVRPAEGQAPAPPCSARSG